MSHVYAHIHCACHARCRRVSQRPLLLCAQCSAAGSIFGVPCRCWAMVCLPDMQSLIYRTNNYNYYANNSYSWCNQQWVIHRTNNCNQQENLEKPMETHGRFNDVALKDHLGLMHWMVTLGIAPGCEAWFEGCHCWAQWSVVPEPRWRRSNHAVAVRTYRIPMC